MPSRSSSRGNGGSPAPIGVPRFELGTSPTRTERATRLRHTPSRNRLANEKRRDRVGAGVRPLSDQQMATVRNDSQRGLETARVLDAVVERDEVVAGAPEDDRRAVHAVELRPRVAEDK